VTALEEDDLARVAEADAARGLLAAAAGRSRRGVHWKTVPLDLGWEIRQIDLTTQSNLDIKTFNSSERNRLKIFGN
jgi:hypothetical protein